MAFVRVCVSARAWNYLHHDHNVERTSSTMSSNSPMMQTPDQAPSYYPDAPNDLTGGLPMNLDSLRDGPAGTKPFYPYSTLIRSLQPAPFFLSILTNNRYAIKGSPTGKLLLEDIYYAIETRARPFSSQSSFQLICFP